jgi:hypothetical protein
MTYFPTSIDISPTCKDILNRASTIATLVFLEHRVNKSGQYINDNGKNLIYFWDQIPILLFANLESMFSRFHFPIPKVLNFCTQTKKLKEFLILEFKENRQLELFLEALKLLKPSFMIFFRYVRKKHY